MTRSKWVMLGVVGSLVVAAAGVGAWWWVRGTSRQRCEAKPAEVDSREYRYISLDKIIVMLHKPSGDTSSHYLAMDLVFKASVEGETATREQLPLLRSVAVRDLSGMTLEDMDRLTIDELTRRLNKAFGQSYPPNRASQPFTEALIGKLIVE
jgi:flagellar protein FliL